MAKQSEQILEEQLVAQLQKLNYGLVQIRDEKELIANLKTQLEKHNGIQFSAKEFERVLIILSKGSVFEKAKTLREKQHIVRDNGDNLFFEFINTNFWCQNQFQVTHQITIEGVYKNRYDVTLLINGLPLVHIELKRRGLELKEAFNQINRYQRHSFLSGSALFQYVQIFIISNGVNTKYYANNRFQSYKQTFYWTDKENRKRTNILNGFTSEFLEPCHISKMICKYTVLNETHKILMVLRPYQYFAVEAIIDRVKNSNKNGYIWHSTGSGKTLTSFKASQILMNLPQVKKVVFVVDRRDLDYQTIREFNGFSQGCVDGTNTTIQLVNQFANDTKLIVTTIQKLNTAIFKQKYLNKMDKLKTEPIVFIFDECHRSQFGDTHKRIKAFFKNAQMFGFTGTPIFVENSAYKEQANSTTKALFHECLHKYVITDAIRDENVLKFSVEYVGKYKRKDGSANEIDIEVEAVDKKELMESQKRLEKISNYIIANHDRKTHNKIFNSIFCVSSINMLTKYYDYFHSEKEKGNHNLKIATIFSYTSNEDDADGNGFIPGGDFPDDGNSNTSTTINKHSREKLDEYIVHYNSMFGTNYSTKDNELFYNYFKDVSKKVKDQQIDILLVVSMFLTGFDSPTLNTLYVDKNLKYHGIIQAYSRTNRILNDLKSQGNIVVFRNLKKATDDAITLFSNKEAIEEIIIKPYEENVKIFNKGYIELLKIAPTVNSVSKLETENDELEFIKAFREILRTQNILKSFADFKWEDLAMTEQLVEDYKSKYLDLYDKVRTNNQKEMVSILEDVDFELELIHRDEINVYYILQLLMKLKSQSGKDTSKGVNDILKMLSSETNLRSKRELIEKFILENMPSIKESEDIPVAFDNFLKEEQKKAFDNLVIEENISAEKTTKLIQDYLFAERKPLIDEALNLIEGDKPKILERRIVGNRILDKIMIFVETFINGIV